MRAFGPHCEIFGGVAVAAVAQQTARRKFSDQVDGGGGGRKSRTAKATKSRGSLRPRADKRRSFPSSTAPRRRFTRRRFGLSRKIGLSLSFSLPLRTNRASTHAAFRGSRAPREKLIARRGLKAVEDRARSNRSRRCRKVCAPKCRSPIAQK